MSGTTLQVVRSLPTRWDGRAVTWTDLRVGRGSLDLHFPPGCDECGSDRPPYRALGTVEHGRDPHTGRTSRVTALTAERCPVCLHDVVYDGRTGESWDLGPEDYGRAGSHAVEGSLW